MNIAKRDRSHKYVFLGGSIEMGKAIDWQSGETIFVNELGLGVFNPRRNDWNPDWVQDFTNPEFYQQVTWELNALKYSDYILMVFISGTISPISLLELGLYATSGKISVVSPSGYCRNGNVEIVCAENNVPIFNTIEEFELFFEKNYKKLVGLEK